jgi:hypothetical protein
MAEPAQELEVREKKELVSKDEKTVRDRHRLDPARYRAARGGETENRFQWNRFA